MIPKFAKVLVMSALSMATLNGCKSGTQAGGQSHAAVEIKEDSMDEIQRMAVTVFLEEGYSLMESSPMQMLFERPGSRRDRLKWGNLGGGGVNMRVRLQFSTLVNGNRLLQADAYAIQISDDPFFQSESRNILLNRRPYQKLLNEVAARLK